MTDTRGCDHYETKTDPGDCEECVCSECGGWLADEPGGSDGMCGRCVDEAVAEHEGDADHVY